MNVMRPRFHVPLWAALVLPGAAYLVRSVILRDGNFALDIPADLVALGAYTIALAAVAWARRAYAEEPTELEQDVPGPHSDQR